MSFVYVFPKRNLTCLLTYFLSFQNLNLKKVFKGDIVYVDSKEAMVLQSDPIRKAVSVNPSSVVAALRRNSPNTDVRSDCVQYFRKNVCLITEIVFTCSVIC